MFASAYLLLRSDKVQLWLTQQIISSLTDELKTTVDVKGVDIAFFKKIVLEDLYVEDQKKDTLFYAHRLKLDISFFSLSEKKIIFDDLILLRSKIAIVRRTGEKDFNYRFFLDHFSPADTIHDPGESSWDVRLNGITFINSRLMYSDKNDTSYTKGINFSDIDIRNMNAKITDLALGDTIRGSLQHVSFFEKSGFMLKDMSCSAVIDSSRMLLGDLKINTIESRIVTDEMIFNYKSYGELSDFIEKVNFRSTFKKSRIGLNDIAYFAPDLKGIDRSIDLKGEINGTVHDLKGKNLEIFFGKYSSFRGDISLTGLPDIDEAFIHLNIKELTTGKNDLDLLIRGIPSNIGMLGLIRYKGNLTGFYNDFVAYGYFSTSLGNITSDISMRLDTGAHQFAYHGKIKAVNFNLGRFLFLADYLGKISLDATIDGKGLNEDASGNFKGTISEMEINNYTYRNITAEGDMAKRIFNGAVVIADNNIDLKFKGRIDFTGPVSQFDFESTVNHADLDVLNLVKTKGRGVISMEVKVRASGNNPDNLLGEINVKNLRYLQNREEYTLKKLRLASSENNGKRYLRLDSDIANGEIEGTFRFSSFQQAFTAFIGRYASYYANEGNRKKTDSNEEFKFNITAVNTSQVTKLFFPRLSLAPNTSAQGAFNLKTNFIDLKINCDSMKLYGVAFEKFGAAISGADNSIGTRITCEKIIYSENVWVNNFDMASKTQNDSSVFSLEWEKNAFQHFTSSINGILSYTKDEARLNIKPSSIYVSDSLWTISRNNEIIVDTGKIEVRGIEFVNGNQQVKIEGIVSRSKVDQLTLSLSAFNLSNVNYFTRNASSVFKGTVSGNTVLSGIYVNPVFSSDLNFEKLYLNNELIGNGVMRSAWDKESNTINFNGSFTRGIAPNIQFSGLYRPSKKEDNIHVEASMEALRLQFFEEYIRDYCSDFKGQLSGKIIVKGSLQKPVINGRLNVQAKKVKVNYLNTVYSFSSDINIEDNFFGVENLKLYDQNSNYAMVTGKLYHDNFKKFQLDFDINAHRFMCLNTTEAQNNLYFGKAFATGIVNMFGPPQSLLLEANVKTEKGTQVSIPLSGAQEVTQSDFVTFVKKDTVAGNGNNGYKVKLDGMQLNFNLDVTPDAEVLLIFDAQSGDIIRGRGNGNIKMTINTLGNFNMYGDYVVENGDYLFTLKNIINKKFDIERGGTIRWSGDPYNADINIAAVYKLKTSLAPLFPDDITGVYKKRYPVNCRLLLSDQLLRPDISFDIDLPTVDESTEQIARERYEQNMNEQVFSLLLLNSFVPDKSSGIYDATAGAATSSELLSNQLTNMLSKMSNRFDLGVKYRPADQLTSQQVEVGVSTQLLNDRISIDGSVGVAGSNPQQGTETTQNTNNIVGDVNVEYKISRDGKLRAKAFNKSNDNTALLTNNGGQYTQGAGIAYKEEFNTLKDLYRRYLAKRKKKKEAQ